MKERYGNLSCPHCGSHDFKLESEDIFVCNYCQQKFNFDLDQIDYSSSTKIFRDELKNEFYNRIQELSFEKNRDQQSVVYYSKKANPRVLTPSLIVGLLLSISLIFTFVSIALTVIGVLGVVGFSVGIYFSVKRSKRLYKQYNPIAMEYAKNVVQKNSEIMFYTRLISKLMG